jgi:hypothetical protein
MVFALVRQPVNSVTEASREAITLGIGKLNNLSPDKLESVIKRAR